MNKTIGLILITISLISAEWLRMCGASPDAVPPQTQVIKSNSGSVCISTILFGFTANDTLIDGKNFRRMVIPGEEVDVNTGHAGMPQIPFIRLKIAVPDSCDFSISANSAENNTVNDFLLYPVPNVVFDDTGGLIRTREVYTYDTIFYGKDTLYPNKQYDIISVGHWRDQRIMEIVLYPVQFDPHDKIVYFASRMELKINYVGQAFFNSNGLGPFEGLARDILLNYPGIDHQLLSHPDPTVHYYTDLRDTHNVADYIIVTHESFLLNETTAPKIQAFAQWRVKHNKFDVAVVSMSDVVAQFNPSGHDSTQLRNFLIYAYENWHAYAMPDDHFAYCLFIGDWNYVPTVLSNYTESERDWLGANDHYFTVLGPPSSQPYIMLGRWPVKVGKWQDLVTIADKTINYEQSPTLGDWRRDVFLTAGDLGGGLGFNSKIYQCFPYVNNIGYDTIIVTKFIGPGSLPDNEYRDSVQKYLNTGNLLTTYIDHGDPKGWDSYDTTDLKTLANGARLPVVFSNACLTAMFQWDTSFYGPHHFRPHSDSSFGELMLVRPGGGAVAFWGATVYSNIPDDQTWCQNMFVYQNWILGYSADARFLRDYPGCYCLLGDPALDLGDYTAYPTLPDLVVRPVEDDFVLLDPYPYPGTNATIPIRAKIMNIGHVRADNVAVKFSISKSGSTFYENTVWVSQILPRDSAIAISYWNAGTTHPNFAGEIGNCDITVIVNPNQVIPESWYLNNSRTIKRKVALYPYLTGWSKKVSTYSQPALGNIDRFGNAEIVYASLDSIYIFNPDGTNFGNWPKYFKGVAGLTLANINADQNLEIIAYSKESLKVYNYQGNVLSGWPVARPESTYYYDALPAIGHIENFSTWSIVVVARPNLAQPIPQPMHLLIYAANGQLNHNFILSHAIGGSEVTPSVSIGNMVVDVNEHDEIVISYCDPSDTGTYKTEIFNNSGLIRTLDYGNTETVGLVDLNNDGLVELIVGDGAGRIKAYDVQNDTLLWDQPTELTQIKSSPVIGDIYPGPGYPGVEINFGTNFQKAHLRLNSDGSTIYPWPDSITGAVRTSDAIGHINGDNNLDIITTTQGFYLYTHTHDRLRIAPYPLPFFGFMSSPVIGDINGDRKNEVIISTSDHYLHVLKNGSSSVTRYLLEWPQFHHDYQHTGLFGW